MQEGPVKWENIVVEYKKNIEDCLRYQGEDGFELVQVVGDLYYFKRQKKE